MMGMKKTAPTALRIQTKWAIFISVIGCSNLYSFDCLKTYKRQR